MKYTIINILKSFGLSILINFIFLYIFSFIFNTEDAEVYISSICIVFTIIFCTYRIIEELRKK